MELVFYHDFLHTNWFDAKNLLKRKTVHFMFILSYSNNTDTHILNISNLLEFATTEQFYQIKLFNIFN